MWLDARFDSRPMFTIGLLLASIPVSLVAMIYIVRLFTSKIKAGPPPVKSQESGTSHPEE
jgi:hypothetical protein